MSNPNNKLGNVNENDETTMVLLVLHWKSSLLGCVYYLHQFRELYFIMDVKNMDLKDIVLELLHQIQPTHVILCKSNDPELTTIIENYDPDIKVESMHAKSFTYQKGRQELINWYIDITPNTATASTSLQQQQHYYTASSTHSALSGHSTPMYPVQSPQDRQRKWLPSSSPPSQSSYYQHNSYLSDDDITKQALLNLSSRVPMDSSTTITCLAPLFDAFKEGLFGFEMVGIKPMNLQTISLPDTMHVPIDVIRSLEIFQPRLHPSTHQKKGKEITSLYHLLNYTVSPGGTHLLKQWILRPSLSLEIINERQESVAFFMDMDQRKGSSIKKLFGYLKHVKNMARILGHIYEHRAKVSEWHQLLQFIYYVIKVDNLFRLLANPADAPIVEKFMGIVDVELLTRIGKYINDNISFEQSQLEGRLIIKNGVDRTLDLLRSRYEALDDYLVGPHPILYIEFTLILDPFINKLQVAHEISAPLPVEIGHLLNVVYFPQLGYLLTLPSTALGYFAQNLFLDGGCALQFTTQENCYYKNMDEQIGDLHGMIVDKQIELIQDISEQILQYRQLILAITQTLAELDCLLSFSMTAIHNCYIRPQMTEDEDDQHELTIIQGRHPLQELVMDTFIANDTFLASGATSATTTPTTTTDPSLSHQPGPLTSSPPFVPPKPRYRTQAAMTNETVSSARVGLPRPTCSDAKSILLLTGANYSGKSIYLKQIGLIVYMAHLGSFVPAERAVISVVDKLFTSIQTAESVSTSSSAFGYDLLQISHALRYATEKSLVILDEFGKGTNTEDGAGLFAAVLNDFSLRKRGCPKVVATTHFHELIDQGVLTEGPRLRFYTTEIMYGPLAEGANDGKEQVVFLYRVVPGQGVGASFGSWCASLGGIPGSVLERATRIYQQLSQGMPYERPTLTQQEMRRYEDLNGLLARFINLQGFEKDEDASELQSIIDSVASLL